MKLISSTKKQFAKVTNYKNKMVEKNRYLAFANEIHSKMVDDNASFKVGGITYYMFLSILPLLLFALTIFDIIFESNPDFRDRVINSTFSTIPVVGPTLESNLSFVQDRGLTLVFSLVVILWAMRKGAIALQTALFPILKKTNIKDNRNVVSETARAYLMMLIISVGLFIPTVFNSMVYDHFLFSVLIFFLNILWNSAAVYLIYAVAVDKKSAKGYGVIFAGVWVTLIQFVSVVIVGNSLDNSRPLYGTLAVVLALLIWLSLQIRGLVYGAVINSVTTK